LVRPLAVQHPSWSAADRVLTTALHGQYTGKLRDQTNLPNTSSVHHLPIAVHYFFPQALAAWIETPSAHSTTRPTPPTSENAGTS
jgi:hypothetical protein